MLKAKAREKMQIIRKSLSFREEKDGLIKSRALNLLSGYSKVFIYVSIGSEADTKGIIKELVKSGKTVYVPYTENRITHACKLTSLNAINSADSYGNVDCAYEFYDGQAEVSVVPMLAYNGDCYRLGYGAGCYDSYFYKNPQGLKIGLAYSEQYCDFNVEPHDIPLDIIITPDKVLYKNKEN